MARRHSQDSRWTGDSLGYRLFEMLTKSALYVTNSSLRKQPRMCSPSVQELWNMDHRQLGTQKAERKLHEKTY